MINRIGKNLLSNPIFKNVRYVLNFNREVIDEFIIDTVRKEVRPGSRILDAGAGTVRYRHHFPDCDYVTQDLKEYKGLGGKFQYGNIDYISDINSIPIEDNSIDVVICTEVLEHIPQPDLAIKEFSRILKPGGRTYITAPLGSGIHQSPLHYYGGFSPSWYHHVFKKYGFGDIVLRPKKRFFALYSQQTQWAFIYLGKSRKFIHRVLRPVYFICRVVIPLLIFRLDKDNLDEGDTSCEFTTGYLVRATKNP